ncbi:uncharacterized protein LOC116202291 isoform X1 [Punica granatum]|uniref:Uncharacterized protein LOC116202291 isoform X1 n=1 Tax=Punica granatum TaxID=22663 RepID=A0A218Y311_PUNGR|nr:uncharacterized protein LOC116202291 isoform X1 [Punica granatum]OWM91266.1 hypothetical protein CDL15_Pgr000210 [Punica granatum]
MAAEAGRFGSWSPLGAPASPLHQQQRDDHSWGSRSFDNSVNAVSFGFVATAILISMFLVMAIFERFLRPNPPPPIARQRRDLASRAELSGKLRCPSPKLSVYANGVSVLMPGDDIPTYIACPAPVPCPPERVSWPQHHAISIPGPTPTTNTN